MSPAAGWRWVAAVVALFAGVLCIGHLLFLPETYHPVLLRNRAAALSAATGKVYRCEADVIKKFDLRTLVVNQLKVPYILLFTEPIVCILSIYLALVFGILYVSCLVPQLCSEFPSARLRVLRFAQHACSHLLTPDAILRLPPRLPTPTRLVARSLSPNVHRHVRRLKPGTSIHDLVGKPGILETNEGERLPPTGSATPVRHRWSYHAATWTHHLCMDMRAD